MLLGCHRVNWRFIHSRRNQLVVFLSKVQLSVFKAHPPLCTARKEQRTAHMMLGIVSFSTVNTHTHSIENKVNDKTHSSYQLTCFIKIRQDDLTHYRANFTPSAQPLGDKACAVFLWMFLKKKKKLNSKINGWLWGATVYIKSNCRWASAIGDLRNAKISVHLKAA